MRCEVRRCVKFVCVSIVCLFAGSLFVVGNLLIADDKPAAGDTKADAPAAAETEAGKEFAAKLTEWKAILKELRAISLKYHSAPAAEADGIRKQFDEQVAKGEQLLPQLRVAGKAAFAAAPNVDRQLTRFLVKMLEDDVNRDDYEAGLELAQVLIDNNCEQKEIFGFAGVAAFAVNQYDKAEEYFKTANESGVALPQLGQKLQAELVNQKALWEKEAELRKAESAAAETKDALPRVQMTTSKGTLVIELFENEAPETVGNFVSLVEDKFYDGVVFHRVLPGFMAQGGDPSGTGTGGPKYKIYCETDKPEARQHFRGSLSMAHAGKNTGGSQFFLTFVPTSHLNGKHTVFGRVVEGMDVLAKLQRVDPQAPKGERPDKIIEAKVLNKRDHTYEPNKVK